MQNELSASGVPPEVLTVDPGSRRKYEEEVTIDLNNTITRQENEYKAFISKEIELEGRAILNLLSIHSLKLLLGFFVYLLPIPGRPVINCALTYFVIGYFELIYKLVQKEQVEKKRNIIGTILAALETTVIILLLSIEKKTILKLLVPCYLLFALFSLMVRCLEFSDSIDEVFNAKIVNHINQDMFRTQHDLYYPVCFNYAESRRNSRMDLGICTYSINNSFPLF